MMRMRTRRGSWRFVSGFAMACTVAVMLTACPKKDEVSGPPPSTVAGAEAPAPPVAAPAPGPAAAPPSTAPPAKAPAPPASRPAAAPPSRPSQPAARPELPEGTTYFVHTVKYPGETVSIIAAWYLGDKMRFDVLAAANPEINPTLIRVGMKIKIPENLMKTRETMTREFVESFYKRTPREKAPRSGVEKQEEPAPIGPR